MADLSHFKRGQINGARMLGASITKTAQMFSISTGTVSKVITAFKKRKENVSAKHKSGRNPKLSGRNHRTLHRIIRKDRKTKALKITSELNEHSQNHLYT